MSKTNGKMCKSRKELEKDWDYFLSTWQIFDSSTEEFTSFHL